MPVTAVLKQHNMFVGMCCDMDTMTHVSAGAQQVFLATRSCVRVRACVYVCVYCVSSHLAARMPALRVCSIGIGNNLFLSVSVCLSPPPPHLIPPFHPCLSFCLTPSIHRFPLHPPFVYHCLLSIWIHLSSLPSLIPLSIQGPLAWHSISDTSCMSCSDDASALTDQPQCLSSG